MMFDKLDNLEANLEKSNFQYTTIPATADPGNVVRFIDTTALYL
jgi:hypothetical protein